jgi:predicted phosphodiesterase
MNIYLVSDIHVEFHHDFPIPTERVDVVVLAGDIDVGAGMLDVAENYAQRCNVPVIVIAGNHEYYHSDMLELLPAFRRRAAKLKGVYFLEKDSVVINNTRFLGCTLWTNFSFNGTDKVAKAKDHAQQYIADFHTIKYGGRRFTPDDAEAEFDAAYRWMDDELGKPFEGETVVVTHFLPHETGVHSMHRRGSGGDHLTPYFTVDCSALMRKHHVKTWLYGHTHNSIDVLVENCTRLVSNQRGYPNEKWTYTQFQREKMIRIPRDVELLLSQGQARFESLLSEQGGTYSVPQVANQMGISVAAILLRIRNNQLLAFKQDQRWKLPVAQFDLETRQPLNGLAQVLGGFDTNADDISKVIFCLSYYATARKSPLQLLKEKYDPGLLAIGAAGYLDHGAR